MRVAIYFTPPAGHPLTRAAALWLGRDAFSGEATRPPDPAVDAVVTEPARYGFHATIRAPFRLRDGVDLADVRGRLVAFCSDRRPFAIPEVRLDRIKRFLALVPAAPSPELEELERETLEAFEPFRAPLASDEVARRGPGSLGERQRSHLERWGYPFVLDEFRFHMTLTGSLRDADAAAVEATVRERFVAFHGAPLAVDGLALFVEDEAGGPFRVETLAPFGA
jgi:putative phosphonate metabolism protein